MIKSPYTKGLINFFKPTHKKLILPLILVLVGIGSMFYFGGYCDHLTNQKVCPNLVVSNIIQIILILGTLGYVVSCLLFTLEELIKK